MAGAQASQDLVICSICLDVLKDPVTIMCGHNYCMGCIKRFWNQEDAKGVYSCPQCRLTFSPRPVLNKNTVLAEIAEHLKKTRIHTAAPVDSYVVHNNLNPGLKVVGATVDERKAPDTRPALGLVSARRKENRCPRGLRQKTHGRETDLQRLRKAVETLKTAAQTAVEDSERMFAEMIRSIERRRSEVTKLIRDQAEAEVTRAEGLLKQLEQEIAEEELQRRYAELEHLADTEDVVYFVRDSYGKHVFQTFQSTNASSKPEKITSGRVSESVSFEAVTEFVSTLKKQLEHICKQEVMNIPASVTTIGAVFTEPTTREDLLKYLCVFTLNVDSAHESLYVSECNRMVSCGDGLRFTVPSHPDRFEEWTQVLCREAVSGCCYWEVEWTGGVSVAVSYKRIRRRGGYRDGGFGYNHQSWSLETHQSSVRHKSHVTYLLGNRIGVYVDPKAGTLAFYSVSGFALTLLHRVQTTFTDTLYPGFLLKNGASVKLL